MSMLDVCESRTVKKIIVGDFNAHHSMWGSDITNSQGRHLLHTIDQFDLVVLNTTTYTRVDLTMSARSGCRGSLIDLTLASNEIANRIETTVTDHLLGSDHFIIETKVGFAVPRYPIHIPAWSFSKANWDKYSRLTSRYISAPPEDANLNLAVEKFSEEVIRAAREAIPVSRPTNMRKRMVPWWNVECSRAIRRKRAAFLKMKRSFRYAGIMQFKELRALARKTILHAKKSYWKKVLRHSQYHQQYIMCMKCCKINESIKNADDGQIIKMQ